MTHAMEMDLPVPVIKEALTNNTLYPMHALGGATAVVEYEMDTADSIILYCAGPAGIPNPTFEKSKVMKVGAWNLSFLQARSVPASVKLYLSGIRFFEAMPHGNHRGLNSRCNIWIGLIYLARFFQM